MDVKQPYKSRPISNLFLLIASLLISSVNAFFSIKPTKQNKYRDQSGADAQQTLMAIVVPKQNMARGEILTSQNLSIVMFPKQQFRLNMISDTDYHSAIGQRTTRDIVGGVPLRWAHLGGSAEPIPNRDNETGLSTLTIALGEMNAVTGTLHPKDIIDLRITYMTAAEGRVSRPLMCDLRIVATGVKTLVDNAGQGERLRYSTITVQVTPEAAEKILLAQAAGTITAVHRFPLG